MSAFHFYDKCPPGLGVAACPLGHTVGSFLSSWCHMKAGFLESKHNLGGKLKQGLGVVTSASDPPISPSLPQDTR